VAVAWIAGPPADTFPHIRHEGLFPTCSGCHEGVVSGDASRLYPTPDACAACHDGTIVRRVDWAPRQQASPGNLRFSHPEHLDATGSREDPQSACATCHRTPQQSGRMAVGAPRPELCLACHAHEATSHLAPERDCLQCHLPLARATALSDSAVAALPRPAWHDSVGFGSAHAPAPERATATCAVCHARESCTRCHMNGESVAAIRALQSDTRVATHVRDQPPAYPTPASHDAATWRWGHGATAMEGVSSCANCHTRASCATCHAGSFPILASLPAPPASDPRGVRIPHTAEVHPPGFQTRHGVEAADGGSTCAGCHAQEFCADCHAGAATPRFHEPDFVDRHGPDVYAADVECTSCHSTEVFCRACHGGSGLASRGRLDVAFHTSNPFWLTGHGQAARQGLEGCVTCHSETDCLRCHAAVGGWGINPHGPGFDPSRLSEVGRLGCLPCHRGGIPGGGP
jgi:hypothetical protein